MSWYRAGTAQVTTGSAAVLGTGTLWVAKVKIGEGFLGPDNVLYEIENVSSDQSLTLTRPYAGASDPAATYAIVPTQGYLRVLATQVADLIALYSAVPENVEDAEAAATNAAASAATATLQASAAQTSANFSEYARTQAEAAQAAASESEDAAAASAAAAATKATEAATSASGALASQGAAGGSATAAANSATTASTKASEASTSASNAAGSATTATTKAGEAAASASDALASKNSAASSATAADASADAAAISEINAAGSEAAADASATAASASAADALAYRDQTQAIADTIEAGAVISVAGRTGEVVLTKSDVGLSNVANTAPADLPISTATATALAGKQASLGFTPVRQGTGVGQSSNNIAIGWSAAGRLKGTVDNTDLGNIVFDSHLTKANVGLSNVDNTSDANKPISTATQNALNGKMGTGGGTFTGAIQSTFIRSTGNVEVFGSITSTAAGVSYYSTGYSNSGSIAFNNFMNVNPTYGFVMSAQHNPGVFALIEFQMGGVGRFRFDSSGWGESSAGWRTYSDARLKYDLQEITGALDKIDALVGYTYLRNDASTEFDAHLKRHVGLLAQDAQKIQPEAVTEASDGYLTLNYSALIPLIVNALKALKVRVIALEQRLA